LGRTDLKAHIDANIEIGINEFEIQGTPGFVIDGAYQRVFSLEDVSKALDEALEASQ
jgi:protein-disulfide isomerase